MPYLALTYGKNGPKRRKGALKSVNLFFINYVQSLKRGFLSANAAQLALAAYQPTFLPINWLLTIQGSGAGKPRARPRRAPFILLLLLVQC